ncbi:hypothetical protein QLH51_06500 [Sphingomonas sp. 2R-10]|nr:hypothetical protein [Sphingomonas sp. 2R-10]MDJ0276446.1 hypothetical protein [Sphingomonas sp. 2R-10]
MRNQTQFSGADGWRYASRIAGGRVEIYGKSHPLPFNDKTNSLHAGLRASTDMSGASPK